MNQFNLSAMAASWRDRWLGLTLLALAVIGFNLSGSSQLVAPTFEDFEGITAGQVTTPPAGWTFTGTTQWYVRNAPGGGTPAPGWDIAASGLPSTDHTTGSGSYIWNDGSTPAYSVVGGVANNEVISPNIDISGLTTPYFSMWVGKYNVANAGLGQTQLSVYYWDGAAWVEFITYTDRSSDQWTEVTAVLPGGVPATTQFRFVAWTVSGSAFYEDILIDDVFVGEPPACIAPSDITASAVDANTVDVSWTCASCTGDFYVEYGPPGFTPGSDALAGTGTVVGPIAGTSTQIGSLMADTDYAFVVRQDCGVDGFSFNTSGASVFTGYCEGGPTSPSDSNLGVVSGSGLGGSSFSYDHCAAPFGPDNGALGTTDQTALSFDVADGFGGSVTVEVAACDGSTFTNQHEVWVDWNNNLAFEPGESIGSGSGNPVTNTYAVLPPPGTPLGTYRMRVMLVEQGTPPPLDPCDSYTWGSMTDFSVNVVAPPACTPPTADFELSLDCGISEFSILVDLTSIGDSPGGVDISNDFDANVIPGATAGGGAGPNGEYVVGPFPAGNDVVVTLTHLGDPVCNISSSALGTTCQACQGGPTSTADSNVELVEIFGFGGTSISHAGCSPAVAGTEDLTAQSVDVPEGFSYNLSVTYGTCGGSFAGAGSVWVDWNEDLIFAPSELVGDWTGTPPAAPQIYGVAPPPGTALGPKLMRVMQQEGGALPLDPCATYTWGSMMDFTVNVVANPGCLPAAGTVALNAGSCVAPNDQAYFIDVTITDAGDSPAGEVTISNDFDATTIPSATVAGSPYVLGPFPSGTPVSVTLEHGSVALCNQTLPTFNHFCPPPNNLCADRQVLTVQPEGGCAGNFVSGATEAASEDLSNPYPSCLVAGLTGVFYEFSTGANPSVEWEITPGTIGSLGIQVLDACGGTEIFCTGGTVAGLGTGLIPGLAPNSTYILRLLSFPATSGTFDICLSEGPIPPTLNCVPGFNATPAAAISSTIPAGTVSTISVADQGASGNIITDLDVVADISHTWVGDMTITLTSPCGTTVTLQDGVCGSVDDMQAQYDDEATDDLTAWCTNRFGPVIPQDALSVFDNENIVGDWTLTVVDNVGGDDGTLNQWCLVPTLDNICVTPEIEVTAWDDQSITIDLIDQACVDEANYASFDVFWDAGASSELGVTLPYTVTGLNPGQLYVIDVQANCIIGGTSLQTGVAQYTDACAPGDLCTYQLTLSNTSGNGWDGALAQVDNGWNVADYTLAADQSSQTFTINACPGLPITLGIENGGNGALPGNLEVSFVNGDGVEVYAAAGPPESTLYSQSDGCPDCAAASDIQLTRTAADLVEVSWTNIALPGDVDDIDVIVVQPDPFGGDIVLGQVNVPAGTTSASVPLTPSSPFASVDVQVITNCTNEGAGLNFVSTSLPGCNAADQCLYRVNQASTSGGWGPLSLDFVVGASVLNVGLSSGTSGTFDVWTCAGESIDIVVSGESGPATPPFCDEAQATAGFPGDLACETAVCAIDGFCCSTSWDGLCASTAAAEPACAGCLSTAGGVCADATFDVVFDPLGAAATIISNTDFCDFSDGQTIYSGTTCPTCFPSTALVASNVDFQGADINWNSDNGAGTTATVYLGLPGFTPGVDEEQSQVFVTTGTNPEGPVSFSGLLEETTYQVIIIEDCGGGDVADASAPVQFTTGALGESCSSPIPIDCTAGTVSGNTTGVPNDNGTSGAGTCVTTVGTGGQIWYAFTPANNNSATLSLCGSGYDTKIHVYQGSCGALTCVTGNDDFCGLQSEVTFDAVGGETYLVRVGGFTSSEGAFDLTVTCGPTIDCFSPTVNTNVVCSGTGFDVLVDIGADGTASGYTVSYTQNAGAPVTVGSAFTPGTIGINLGTEFAFGDIIDVSVVDNDFPATCFVDVTGVTTLAGDCPPPNDVCSTALPITVNPPGGCPANTETFDTSNGTESPESQVSCDGTTGNFDVFYTFTAPASGGVVVNRTQITSGTIEFVVKESCGGAEVAGSCTAFGATPVTVTGLTPGDDYILQIWNDSFNVGSGSVCLEATPPPPANDECSGALPIACNSTETGTTAFAGNTDAPATCITDLSTAPGVWYTVGGIDGEMVASLCGSSFDTKIGVFSGSCGALTCVIGNDDFCGLQSEASWIGSSAETYYIYVTGFGTASGAYTLNLDCFPFPANNDCVDAQSLTPAVYPNTNNTLGTLSGATNNGATACVGTNGPDVFYTFNVPLENHYWVNLNPFGGFAGVVEVLDACDGTVIACESAPASAPFCDVAQGTPGFPSDPACEASVCAADAFCCNNSWDGICAGDALTNPACSACLSTAPAGSGPISVFIQNLTPGDYIVRIRDYFGNPAPGAVGSFLVNVQSFPFAGVQDNPNNFLYACNQGGFQLEDFVGAVPQSGQGALDYEWYIYEEAGTFSNEWQRGEPNYASRCTWLGMDYGTTYNVYVRILLDVPNVGPVWGVYKYLNPSDPFAPGASDCTISTATNVTPTEVRPNYTPTNVNGDQYALCDFVVAFNVSESEQFRWRFDGNNNFGDAEDIEYLGSSSPSVRLSWVPGLLPGATYNVGVEVRVDGQWSGYSTIHPIDLALPPNTVSLRSQWCDGPATSFVLSETVCAANSYTFEFVNQAGGATSTFTSGNYVCFLNNLSPAIGPGTYDVRVKVTQGGIAGDFGPVCVVTVGGPGAPTPDGISAQREVSTGGAVLFPNPSAGDEVRVQLDGLTAGNHEVNVMVYDVYGKLISSDGFGHEGTSLNRLIRFDGNLAMGMYMVHIMVDGEQFAVERLVVK